MSFPVRAITLDLDDTVWPFAPIGARIGRLNPHYALRVSRAGQELLNQNLPELRAIWSDATRRIEAATGLPVFAFPKLREFFVDMRLKA